MSHDPNGDEDNGLPPAAQSRKYRGFASMSSGKRRQVASRGGRAAHALGTAHEWTSEEAKLASKKGKRSKP